MRKEIKKITRKKVTLGKHYKKRKLVPEIKPSLPTKGWKQEKILGLKVTLRKYKQTSVEDFIKYNQAIIADFIKRQEERTGRKITNVRQYISNYLKTYKYDFIEFIKKAAASPDLRFAVHAYELLVDTGSIEDLQVEVQEEILINRIHYIGNNNYEYIGEKRKCRFEIKYENEGRSHVEIIVGTGVDI